MKYICIILKIIFIMISIIIIYLLISLVSGSIAVHSYRPYLADKKHVDVFLVADGVHTDIVVPIKNQIFDWRRILAYTDANISQYVAIGWGEKEFYLETSVWSDLQVDTALKALSGWNESVMHVRFYPNVPQSNNRTVHMALTLEEYHRLVEHIASQFVLNEQQQAQIIFATNNSDVFYQAHGHFHVFYTCNTWVNDVLKQSGLPAVVWTPFSYSIMNLYR